MWVMDHYLLLINMSSSDEQIVAVILFWIKILVID